MHKEMRVYCVQPKSNDTKVLSGYLLSERAHGCLKLCHDKSHHHSLSLGSMTCDTSVFYLLLTTFLSVKVNVKHFAAIILLLNVVFPTQKVKQNHLKGVWKNIHTFSLNNCGFAFVPQPPSLLVLG